MKLKTWNPQTRQETFGAFKHTRLSMENQVIFARMDGGVSERPRVRFKQLDCKIDGHSKSP